MPRCAAVAALVLVAQASVRVAAFTAPPPLNVALEERLKAGWPAGLQPASLGRVPAPAAAAEARPLGRGGLFAGSVLAGAIAALLGVGRREAGERDELAGPCRVWTRMPATPNMLKEEGDWTRGPRYRTYKNLERYAKKVVGRQRFLKQQKYLAEAGISCAKGQRYHVWYPKRDEHNLYKGPESHPDNPYFPAASQGMRAVQGWAAAQLSATAPRIGAAGAFAGAALPAAPALCPAKRAGRPVGRAARSGLVMKAHKKAAASSKNQGRHQNPKRWGVAKKGLQGCAVKAGQVLVRQKGMTWYPGANVKKARDFTLHSLKDGIVQWRGEYKHREVFVVPWEYVRANCMWINPNTLGPKVYKPWMGNRNWGKRHHILKLRREYLETDEGKAWLEKKEEKRQKQQDIQAKIRAYRKLRRIGMAPAKAGGTPESVEAKVATFEETFKAKQTRGRTRVPSIVNPPFSRVSRKRQAARPAFLQRSRSPSPDVKVEAESVSS